MTMKLLEKYHIMHKLIAITINNVKLNIILHNCFQTCLKNNHLIN